MQIVLLDKLYVLSLPLSFDTSILTQSVLTECTSDFGITMGHTILAISYLYRLHVTFKNLPQYAIRKRFNLILIVIFAVIMLVSVVILIAAPKQLVNVQLPSNPDLVFCTNQNSSPINLVPWLVGLFTQSLFSGYVLFCFVSRLYDLQKELRVSSHKDAVYVSTESDAENDPQHRQVLELNRLMLKMSVLVTLSIIVSWLYVVVGIFEHEVSLANSWNLIVDVVCSYLLFVFAERIWFKLVRICYYPCCCFAFCPIIKP